MTEIIRQLPYGAEHFSYLEKMRSDLEELEVMGSEQVVDQYSVWTRERLNQPRQSIPVMACAFNEQSDLPKMVVGLARSSLPLNLIVINNGSKDNTKEIAQRMGAIVIDEPERGTVNAYRAGFRYFRDIEYKGPILTIDCDCYPGEYWADCFTQTALTTNSVDQNGGYVSGPVLFYGASVKRQKEALRLIKQDYANAEKGIPRSRGGNALVYADNTGRILDLLANMRQDILTGVDSFTMDIIRMMGGIALYNPSLESLVYTRGDRYKGWLGAVKNFLPEGVRRKLAYRRDWFQDRSTKGGIYYKPGDMFRKKWIKKHGSPI